MERLLPEEQAFVQQLRGRPDDADVACQCLQVIEDVLERRRLVQLVSGYVVPNWWAMVAAADALIGGAASLGCQEMAVSFEQDRLLAVIHISLLADAGLLG